jgi:hypothetical protein
MDELFKVTPQIPEEPVGWLNANLSKSVMSRLWGYIETAKKNPINYNDKLVGNISKSLLINDKDNWFFKTILIPLIGDFDKTFPLYMKKNPVLTEDVPYCLNSLWVNFQKENEFNPQHNHSGVFSFVIWVKIPTNWKEQHALPFSANSNTPKASDFEFQYTTMLGNFGKHSYFLDKEAEGQMLFFPAKLMHEVYPFYNCDKERISISGNIFLDTSEGSMKQYRSQQKVDNN